MPIKIAVIADIHYAEKDSGEKRKGSLGNILLLRAIHRLNRAIKPDVTVLLGDLLDDGDSPDAGRLRQNLNDTINILDSPSIILPGNHDGNVENFYVDFTKPPESLDIKGHRLISFVDPEEPGFNARRREKDLKRMECSCKDFDGPVIMLQHTPLFPPGSCNCPFNYTNIENLLGKIEKGGIKHSISAHFHEGSELIRHKKGNFSIAPALCEEPFRFLEIKIDGGKISTTLHSLQVTPAPGLIDFHVHSPFAYCNENMSFPESVRLAGHFGLAGLSLTEHSAHLYFSKEEYRSRQFLKTGLKSSVAANNRMENFLVNARAFSPPAKVALEVDSDYSGRPVVLPEDAERADILLGAVHALPELTNAHPRPTVAADQYLAIIENFLKSGIKILAHPFRVFRRKKYPSLNGFMIRP